METTQPDSPPTGPAAVALALAACAALSFAVGDATGFLTPSAEAVFTLSWMVGWGLLAWATIVAGVASVHLLHGVASRRRLALIDAVLVVATVGVIVVVIRTHPLVGSGAGVG